MIEELIQTGDYQQALSMLNDFSDENVRYLRLVCLVGLGEYHQAKEEGFQAKIHAKNVFPMQLVILFFTTIPPYCTKYFGTYLCKLVSPYLKKQTG